MTGTNPASAPGGAGDVVDFLLQQHQQIKALLGDVLQNTGEDRQRHFDAARELLARHETAEEMIVRPLTRKAPDGRTVADGRMAEENEAKTVLADLERRDVNSPEFEQQFTAFRLSVIDHAAAEEREEFPLLRTNTDAEALTKARDRLQRAEKWAPTHPHPSAKTTAMNYVAGPFAAMLDRARDALKSRS